MVVVDSARPLRRDLSIFYLLPIAYVAWRVTGWLEWLLYAAVTAAVYLVPAFTSPNGQTAAFNRSLGVLLGLMIIFLMRERRRYAAALAKVNDDLEERVAARTAELRQANDCLSREISERLKAEECLRNAQKMEAIGRLAGGVAHDFNNLLTVINGYCQILIDGLVGNKRLHEYSEIIVQAGNRAAKLTQQLLAFSRKQVLQPRVVDLNELVVGIDKLLRPLIGAQVELVIDLAADLRPVRVDPGQLEQVLINLAINARDAMPEGGALRVETANAELNGSFAQVHPEFVPGRYVLLAVHDNGCGMDEMTRTHLFEPFFTTKGVGKGTGLGLATSYGIIKQSGGYIHVESQAGKGTVFRIYLPVAAPDDKASNYQPAANGAPGGSETLLVVEDEECVRSFVSNTLRSHGYTVREAAYADEAIYIFNSQQPPDLLITDIVMPRMSGRQLSEHLRQERPGLKVLFMSGYASEPPFPEGGVQDGMDFLPKPFTATCLAAKVRQVLDN
jgi:signal transduction histidine kinase/CheY-like chemotaxis protein